MNSKTLKIILCIILLALLIINFSYWAEAISYNNDFLYNAIFFWLTGIAFLCSWGFLIAETKKINDKVWIPLTTFMVTSGYILNRNFGGASLKIENKVIGIFSEPIMWLLIATLIGHLVLFFYKRNKPQIS